VRSYTASHQNAFSTLWMQRSKERTRPAMPRCAPCSINGCKGPNGRLMSTFPYRPGLRQRSLPADSGCAAADCRVPLADRPFPTHRGRRRNHRRLRDRLHAAVLDGSLLRSDCGRRGAIGRRAEQRRGSGFAGVALRSEPGARCGSSRSPAAAVGAGRSDPFRHRCRRRTRTAPLVYVSPVQINFVVPDGTAPGLATLVVSGRRSPPPCNRLRLRSSA